MRIDAPGPDASSFARRLYARLLYARMVRVAMDLDETGWLGSAMICGELETGEEQALAELAGESLERESAINH